MKNYAKQARLAKRMSIKESAEALKVSSYTIMEIERERYSPSVLLALRMADYYGKRVEDLFTTEESDVDKARRLKRENRKGLWTRVKELVG